MFALWQIVLLYYSNRRTRTPGTDGANAMGRRLAGVLLFVALAAPCIGAAQTVDSADIVDGSIQAIDIAPETITSGRIKNETIQAIDIAPETITTGRIKNGTIQAIDIAPETITTGRIKNGTIQGIDIAPETIGGGRLIDRSIIGEKLKFANTIFVDALKTPTENCAALRDALNSHSNTTVQLGRGTYDCGTNRVRVTANNVVVGAGRRQTIITGNGAVSMTPDIVWVGNGEVRSLSVMCYGDGIDGCGSAVTTNGEAYLSDMFVGYSSIPVGTSVIFVRVGTGYLSDVEVVAPDTTQPSAVAIYVGSDATAQLDNVTARTEDPDSAFSAALSVDQTTRASAKNSVFRSGGGLSLAINAQGLAFIAHSEVDGPAAEPFGNTLRCIGAYNGDFVALDASCQ
jgi:hypothetical protein